MQWIWNGKALEKDSYVEFIHTFKCSGKTFLTVSVDGIYTLELNGKLVGFSQCADYPYFKYADTFNVTKFLKEQNELKITVWHFGENTQNAIQDDAGLYYKVECEGKTVAESSVNTLSRVVNQYFNGYKKIITSQLGYSFLYDATKKSLEYEKSVPAKNREIHFRDVKLKLTKRANATVTQFDGGYLIDFKKETVGYLDLDFTSCDEQKLTVAYGEHAENGNVSRILGSRDFSFEYVAKKGKNKYFNGFRRIACRYLQVFTEKPLKIKYFGLKEVVLPVTEKPKTIKDDLLKKIYDTCVYTLKCCMHEHYEDCPWREQGLYTMDSRNQMLCGYFTFKGHKYQRHNLVLISKGLRKDGLLSICFPCGSDVPIPFFSLIYIIQVYEYVKYTKDKSILNEVMETVDTIVNTFTSKIDGSGLIPSFPYPYWNFYEWAKDSNNEWQITRSENDKHVISYDLILNTAYVYAMSFYKKLSGKTVDTTGMKKVIEKTFYNGKTYKLSTNLNTSSELGNAMAILAGLKCDGLKEIIVNGNNDLIGATLSMRAFVYDALLKGEDTYKDFILQDIKKRYKKMLDKGATTFWETELGYKDFDNAGSLCHGWSAIPVYYINELYLKGNNK